MVSVVHVAVKAQLSGQNGAYLLEWARRKTLCLRTVSILVHRYRYQQLCHLPCGLHSPLSRTYLRSVASAAERSVVPVVLGGEWRRSGV